MLAIEVAFITGRYVATAYNTRDEGEWPPHPARLFSALVATHHAGDGNDRARERTVLEWLEQQEPPAILASDAARRDVVTSFVPVNDVALTSVDDEAQRVELARVALREAEMAGGGREVAARTRAVAKAETNLARAIAQATAVLSRHVDPRYGRRVLPEYRTRQPRTFPSMTPADPRVTYVWADAHPTVEQSDVLDQLARRVVRVGHSSSLVAVRVIGDPGEPTWRPDRYGEVSLRVVQKGQLDALERAYDRHRETESRVLPAVTQTYSRRVTAAVKPLVAGAFSDQWLVLRRTAGPLLPMTAAAGVARALRRALMSFAGDPSPEVLSGHLPGGEPSSRVHAAFVPLPFVGHPHASGTILGIAVVLPRIVDASERRAVYAAIDRWEQRYRQEDEDTPVVQLNLGAAGELRLERVEWGSVPATLRAETWCGSSRTWLSATPIALDRNPGDLRAREPERLGAAIEGAAESVAKACERIGLPRPRHVEILPAAPLPGAEKAQRYPPFPADSDRIRRVLTHARLEFDEPVRGPVLLGAGRYLGLGLFRPEPGP